MDSLSLICFTFIKEYEYIDLVALSKKAIRTFVKEPELFITKYYTISKKGMQLREKYRNEISLSTIFEEYKFLCKVSDNEGSYLTSLCLDNKIIFYSQPFLNTFIIKQRNNEDKIICFGGIYDFNDEDVLYLLLALFDKDVVPSLEFEVEDLKIELLELIMEAY